MLLLPRPALEYCCWLGSASKSTTLQVKGHDDRPDELYISPMFPYVNASAYTRILLQMPAEAGMCQ